MSAVSVPGLAADAALQIHRAQPDELAAINARYAEVDFLPSTPDHLIAVAEVNGVMAGLGRIVPFTDGIGELGGMYVFNGWQGRGMARHTTLRGWSPLTLLYCIPFSQLTGLYCAMGFVAVPDGDAVPPPIAAKVSWCHRHYPKPVALLCWRAGAST